MYEILNFIPIIVFSCFTNIQPIPTTLSQAFYLGAVLAIFHIAFFLLQKIRFDYIGLAASIFLMYGALGFIYKPLLTPFATFKEATIFLVILIVGIITTFTNRGGFLQLSAHRGNTSFIGSFALLGLTSIVFFASYLLLTFLKANTIIGAMVPFIGLLIGRTLLKNYFIKH